MLNKEYGIANKEVAKKKKDSKGQDPCTEEIQKVQEIDAKIKEAQKHEDQGQTILQQKFNLIGNLVHESVPISNNEDDNKIERTWGEIKERNINSTPGACHHHEILAMIDGYDMKRGTKIAGHRGYFLKGPGVILNQALQQYGIQFLMKKGYTPIQTPFFMKRQVMAETAQLRDFDDELYKVTTGKETDEAFYLIATSEQPISAMYRKEWLDTKELPIKFAGISTNFRKEAGASGKDVWGIFRIHQFEKVEQFIICAPEDSWKIHEDMIRTSEEFCQSLELPYRVVNIVSGALNDAASKKYDLEAWFPGYGAYRELVSCSNCTDYQSRNLEIRYGQAQAGEKEKKYVHMLNGTLCATQRTLCCLLENYQTDKGVIVPKVLQAFVGTDFIPYVKGIPKKEDVGGEEKK